MKKLILQLNQWKIIKICFLVIILFIGIIANGLVIYISIKKIKKTLLHKSLIINLAVLDFITCGIIIPCSLVQIITKYFSKNFKMCMTIGFLNNFLFVYSEWVLTIRSLFRYFALSKPFFYKKYMTYFIHTNFTFLCLLIAIIITFPPLIGWGNFQPGDNLCLLNATSSVSYVFFVVVFSNIIPIIIIIFSFISIFLTFIKYFQRKDQNINFQLQQNFYNFPKVHYFCSICQFIWGLNFLKTAIYDFQKQELPCK